MKIMKRGKDEKIIIGIDEVGRGSLAGPVTVAVVAIPVNLKLPRLNLNRLRDSKKLTPRQREQWFQYIKSHNRIFYAVASVSPAKIDRINISKSANLAAFRAFSKLTSLQNVNIGKRPVQILLDAGLSLPAAIKHRAFIKGDEKFNCIKLASIVAKVSRDRFMGKMHKKFPVYGFDKHKGYGTKKHFAAIKKYGPGKIHRLTFLSETYKLKSIN